MLTLAAYVRQHGVEVAIFDGEVSLCTQEQLAKTILEWRPDFVGLTATTPDIDLTAEVCRFIKESDPSIITIIGGPHATALPFDVAQHRYVDYVVVGDGELPLVQILAQKTPGQHRTISQNRSVSEKVIQGEEQDITGLPMPAHDLLDYTHYKFTDPQRGQLKTASIMSSRGCPFNCVFCFHNKNMRYRTIQAFISEIEYLYREKDVRYFYVYDDTFFVNKSRVLEIAERIKALQISDAHFQCLTRANLVVPELLEVLREANFVRVSMGIETGSTEILKAINKGVTKEDYVNACQILLKQGMETRGSFIIGHPYETHQTVQETISFAQELELLHANFNIMTPYPGTQIYDMALKGRGLYFENVEDATDWKAFRRWGKSIIRTDHLSAHDLEDLQEKSLMEFYGQSKIFEYYHSLFYGGNKSRYFYRPLNFAWQKKFGRNLPFWQHLEDGHMIAPG